MGKSFGEPLGGSDSPGAGHYGSLIVLDHLDERRSGPPANPTVGARSLDRDRENDAALTNAACTSTYAGYRKEVSRERHI